MKKQLLLSALIALMSLTLSAEKTSLSRAEKFYKSKDLIRAEKEIIRAIQPPFSSMEEWSKVLNYYFLIKSELYCTEESLTANLHELSTVLNTYSECERIDSKKLYIPNLQSKMEAIGDVLFKIANSELEKQNNDAYLTLMDYYVLLSEKIGKDNTLHYKKLAEVSANNNHHGRAVHYWYKMISTGYEVEHAYKEMLALLYDLRQYDNVDNLLGVAKKAYPENSSIREIEILRMIDKDLFFKAQQLALETIEKDSTNLNIVFLLGLINSKLENKDDAVKSFLAVANKDETHFQTHIELGKHFLDNFSEEGNLSLAKHYLEKAEKINPTDSLLASLLLSTYTKLSELRKIQNNAESTSK